MFCCHCGGKLPEEARFCPSCGQKLTENAHPNHEVTCDDGFSALIPKNNSALAAYYIGVFSILFGFVLGPAAIVFGILGLRHASKHPEAKGAIHAAAGIVCGIIGLAVWAAVTMLMIDALK